MRVTNSELVATNENLPRLLAQTGDAVIHFRVAQIVDVISPHIEAWSKARESIIEQYAVIEDGSVSTDNQNMIIWQEGKQEAAIDALSELSNVETDISVTQIKLSRIAEHVKSIDYRAISAISWLIDDDME